MNKMKKMLGSWFVAMVVAMPVVAQNVSDRSNIASVDFSEGKRLKDSSSFPKITWQTPANETTFLKDNKLSIKFDIDSRNALKSVSINVKEKDSPSMRGTQNVDIKEGQKFKTTIERNITLVDGVNQIEVVAENIDGIKTRSVRFAHVGGTALADASKLNRHDYALVFATDKYDSWPQLVNPVNDCRTIGDILERTYGFKVDFVENPSQEQIWSKIREYAEKKYEPLDQLLILFAGHGQFDETFKEGYVVTKESLANDPGKSSYVSHNRLRSNINAIPAEHIFLVMDVCFGGTFDEAIASARGYDDMSGNNEVSQAQFITRKLAFRTRKYLTSGGKEYVSDGVPGKHSPFASKIIAGLSSHGGNDGILSLSELTTYIEKLQPEPKFGKFGSDAIGSEFVFVVKQ